MVDRNDIEDILPLTPMQEMMLFQHELDRQRSDYWNRIRFELHGRVDSSRWRDAWSSVVARYPLLRTRFRRDGKGKALQIVLRRDDLDWHEADLSGMDPQQRSRRLESFQRSLEQPPDLRDNGPLRLGLVRTGESRYTFVVHYHHIVLDGWSEQAMLQAAFDGYDGELAGDGETAPFGAYVRWLQQQDRAASLAFWLRYLEGIEHAALQSPLREEETLAEFRVDLEPAAFAALERMVRETRVTGPSILATVWALTLSAECGCTDLVLGQIVAQRSPPFEETVGPLIATLPIRYRSDGDLPLADWLRRQQQDFQQALQHASISVAEIQQALHRDAAGGLLYALFGHEAVTRESWRTADFVVERTIRSGTTGLALSLVMRDHGDRLEFVLGYAESRYSEAWVERAVGRFQHLLRSLDASAATPLNRLSLLTPGEIAAEPEIAAPASVPGALDLVLAAARRYPENTAVVVGGEHASYAELQLRIRQFAARFAARGLGPGSRAGLYVGRGRELIPAILGLWYLGAVYVPFDPGHPIPRVRAAMRKADLACLLVDASSRRDAASIGELDLIDVGEVAADAPAADHPPRCAADDIAYVLFTSGSTGVPNGVPVRHCGLGNLLLSLQVEPGFTDTDQMLASTTVAFDISIVELLLPLCAGGTVHLATEEQLVDPAVIARMIQESPISVQFATPALWENLLLAGWQGKPGLCCWSGGDKLRADLARQIMHRAGSLWNLYGPTETAICSTLGPVTDCADINVGKPVANTEIRVVDRAGRALPPLVKGELLIGGLGVSPGYVNNAALSAERFVERDGRRFFRTGDLVLYRADGTIEHFGRIDRQIKLRGFRIEPGEIESVLNRIPGVDSSHVMLREIDGDPRLVAYVVESVAGAADDALRGFLPERLPGYMVPFALVRLAELPLTGSGKVDQRALPEPEQGAARPASDLDESERALAEIWQSLLGSPVQSADDDFLSLGGHSLLIARLAGLIQQRFEKRVSIRALLGATRLADQAKLLTREVEATPGAPEYGYLPARQSVFYAWHPPPAGEASAAVILVPPLLSDMTRTRLLYRELALKLQSSGYAVLRFDLSGHGNSAGDMPALGLEDWLEDVRAALEFGKTRLPRAAWSVLSARFGCALAGAALTGMETVHWVTLDPVYSGSEWLRDLQRWRDDLPGVLRACLAEGEYHGFQLGAGLLDDLAQFSTSPNAGERRITLAAGSAQGQPEAMDLAMPGWRHDALQHLISDRLMQDLLQPFS